MSKKTEQTPAPQMESGKAADAPVEQPTAQPTAKLVKSVPQPKETFIDVYGNKVELF
jgi:hypothetical protein